jgi:hypothetical protein
LMHDIGPTPASTLNDQCPLECSSGFYVLRVCVCVRVVACVLPNARRAAGARACVRPEICARCLYNWVKLVIV